MSKCDSIISLNGREYAAIDSMPADKRPDREDGGVRIVVLQRGWVIVGRYLREGPRVTVSQCAVVRRWGTTKGLGELATGGPIKDKTLLDECPNVTCLESEIVLSMACAPGVWATRA